MKADLVICCNAISATRSQDERKVILEGNRLNMRDGTVIEIPQSEFDAISNYNLSIKTHYSIFLD
jgi:hypothetical protein